MTESPAASPAATGSATQVTVLGAPVQLWASFRQWREDVVRELSLSGLSGNPEAGRLGRRIDRLISAMTEALSGERGSKEFWAAQEAGRDRVDLQFAVLDDVGGVASELAAVFDELDDRCRRGEQLTLPMSGGAHAFMVWYFGEIAHQSTEHSAPTPWPGPWSDA